MTPVTSQYQLIVQLVQDHSYLIPMDVELISSCLYGMASPIVTIYTIQ
jgi:hypothetical protein